MPSLREEEQVQISVNRTKQVEVFNETKIQQILIRLPKIHSSFKDSVANLPVGLFTYPW